MEEVEESDIEFYGEDNNASECHCLLRCFNVIKHPYPYMVVLVYSVLNWLVLS